MEGFSRGKFLSVKTEKIKQGVSYQALSGITGRWEKYMNGLHLSTVLWAI